MGQRHEHQSRATESCAEGRASALGKAGETPVSLADKDIRRRLAFIRYLHRVAVGQSEQPEPLQSAAVLTFHDAVELFLHLVFEHLDCSGVTPGFMEYWDRIAKAAKPVSLSGKASMERLNRARVALKHSGLPTAADPVEEFRGSVTNFLEDNTRAVFDVELSSFSMVDLVAYTDIRESLQSAERAIAANEPTAAAKAIAIAFHKLLEQNDVIADLVPEPPYRAQPRFGTPFEEQHQAAYEAWVGEAVTRLTSAIRVLTLGFDFRRYRRFQRLMPRVIHKIAGDYFFPETNRLVSIEACQESLSFVVDCALRVQR
jgi:hypothetical protein